MTAHDEYRAALDEYRAAQRLFDAADPDRVDEAIHRLQAAELRLGAAIRALKGERAAPDLRQPDAAHVLRAVAGSPAGVQTAAGAHGSTPERR